MVVRADQQVSDLVGDHASEQLALIDAGKRGHRRDAIDEHRSERAGPAPDVNE